VSHTPLSLTNAVGARFERRVDLDPASRLERRIEALRLVAEVLREEPQPS
jgi:hypothetical protein